MRQLIITLMCLAMSAVLRADDPAPIANRPKVAGTMLLHARSRDAQSGLPLVKDVEWQAAETAIIICDMWDNHYCQNAAQRVGVMAPRMNEVVTVARANGVMIIHAPSGCMEEYANSAQRQRMVDTKQVPAPFEITHCLFDSE